MSFRRQDGFYPVNMNIRIFPAGAVTQVNAELEHIKAVGHYVLAEPGIYLPVLFGFCRQVKVHKYPHNAVLNKDNVLRTFSKALIAWSQC